MHEATVEVSFLPVPRDPALSAGKGSNRSPCTERLLLQLRSSEKRAVGEEGALQATRGVRRQGASQVGLKSDSRAKIPNGAASLVVIEYIMCLAAYFTVAAHCLIET